MNDEEGRARGIAAAFETGRPTFYENGVLRFADGDHEEVPAHVGRTFSVIPLPVAVANTKLTESKRRALFWTRTAMLSGFFNAALLTGLVAFADGELFLLPIAAAQLAVGFTFRWLHRKQRRTL